MFISITKGYSNTKKIIEFVKDRLKLFGLT